MNPIIRHMTHIRNLSGILEQGGLWCDRQAQVQGLIQQGIGHDHIKKRREKKSVKAGPGGSLCDYVPLYFAHHTPMLYAIHRGGVAGYEGGQDEVIYLVTRPNVVQQAERSFVFTDGHAAVEISRQFTDLAYLQEIDWELIRAIYWTNTDDDVDRVRRKQAEFLVHDFLPWPLIRGIAVRTETMADQVAALLYGQQHTPPIQVMPTWYY